MSYDKLVAALRCKGLSKKCDSCGYGYHISPDSECNDACHFEQIAEDAAAAIEELQAQLPKRGEIVRCGECRYRITAHGIYDGWVICTKPSTERGNAMHRADWFCADGERKVQE